MGRLRGRLRTLLAALLLGGALVLAGAPAAHALGFATCLQSAGFECATLPVPLDRSGRVPGAISLSVERRLAGAGPSSSAVVALAGGPGQPVLPLGEFIARAIAPALASRDLLLFDQRGTGSSNPLSCGALAGASPETAVGPTLERCAAQIGSARGAFTTQESVADLESLRRAGGYERLVLYGTSYGTKVALQYAARYPSRVEALVLDSVVPASGPEPFALASFQAMHAALGELCAQQACARITQDPLADLARLAAALHLRVLRGVAYDGSGHLHRLRLSEQGLLQILEAGDLNPALRALLPAAVRSALRHDPDPLVRLHLLAEGLIPSVPREPVESSPPVDEALFIATSCEDTPFPWQRTNPPAARLAEAHAALQALPGNAFYPFESATAFDTSLIPVCAYWPDASPLPAASGPLPAVPALILSGAQDLRTPTSLAAGVAAQIPGAALEVVPHTGHSVIGSDFSGCAEAAVGEFFSGGTVQPCAPQANLFGPTAVPPTRLAFVRPPHSFGGKAGRTLTAALDALVDLGRQVIGATLQADQELPSGASFGGLRGGFARLTSTSATLHGYSFVPGVALNGVFPVRGGQLQPATIRISGADASPGTVSFGHSKHVRGVLGGRHFNVSLATVHISRPADNRGWPSSPISFPLGPLVAAARTPRP